MTGLGVFFSDLNKTRRLANENQINLLAASLSFFCLFAAVPFIILIVILTNFIEQIYGLSLTTQHLLPLFMVAMPWISETVLQEFLKVIENNLAGSVLNTLLLVSSAYGLFRIAETIFQNLAPASRKRHKLLSILVALTGFVTAGLSSTSFLFLTTVQTETLRRIASPLVGELTLFDIRWMGIASSTVAIIASLTLVFKLMPLQKIKTIQAFRASILFGGIVVCGRTLFSIYLIAFRQINETTFGASFAYIVLTIWTYFLCRAFLFCAQYAIFMSAKELNQAT